MKRLFVVFTIFIYVFTSGCKLENSNEKEQVFASTAPQIMFDKIISALDNKDEEELKSLFAVNALNKAQDIEQQSIDIMEFYKGKFISNSSFDTGSSSGAHGVNIWGRYNEKNNINIYIFGSGYIWVYGLYR